MIETENKNIFRKVINSIGEIGADVAIIQYKRSKGSSVFIDNVIKSLENLGEKVTEKKWEIETGFIITHLGTIGMKLIENELITRDIEYLERKVLISLYSIVKIAIDQDLENPVYGISATITNIGINASDKNLSLANETQTYLDYIRTALLPKLLDISPDNSWIKLRDTILENKKMIENSIKKEIV